MTIDINDSIKLLDNLLEDYVNLIENKKKDLLADYLYCYECNKYFHKNLWKKNEVDFEKVIYVCPNNHNTIGNYWC